MKPLHTSSDDDDNDDDDDADAADDDSGECTQLIKSIKRQLTFASLSLCPRHLSGTGPEIISYARSLSRLPCQTLNRLLCQPGVNISPASNLFEFDFLSFSSVDSPVSSSALAADDISKEQSLQDSSMNFHCSSEGNFFIDSNSLLNLRPRTHARIFDTPLWEFST